jgi:hypothetical protein
MFFRRVSQRQRAFGEKSDFAAGFSKNFAEKGEERWKK